MTNTDGLRTQLKALFQEKGEVWDRMKELAFEGDDGLEAEDVEAYDEAEARLNEVDVEVARIEQALNRASDFEKAGVLPVNAGGAETPEGDRGETPEDIEARYETAFNAWMRGGMPTVDEEQREMLLERMELLPEQRALAAGTDSAGGYTVPEGFWNEIQVARLAFGGILNAGVTEITTTTGNDLPIPTSDDTGNTGELLGENVQTAEQDVTFGQKVLGAYVWSSKLVKVSFQLLNDSAFNMQAFLAARFGERIGRIQSTFLITGTGTNQPQGILTGTTNGKTTASATAFTYGELVDLEHSIDPAYRNAGEYLISDDFLKVARQLEDTTGRPLWVPGLTEAVPNIINQYPYTVDQNMPAVTNATTPAVFGDLSHYWVRNVAGIQMLRLNERFADFLQVAFFAFSRMDARKVDAGNDPFKTLTMLA